MFSIWFGRRILPNLVIKAAILIGSGALVVGFFLYITGHFYIPRRSSANSRSQISIKKLGMVIYGVMVLALFIGAVQQRFAAKTWFGRAISNSLGRLAYAGVPIVVCSLIEYVPGKLGYHLWVPASAAQQVARSDAPASGGPAG